MTDFESKYVMNEPSSDNLSIKNWTLPDIKEAFDEKNEEEGENANEEKTENCEVGILRLIPLCIQGFCKQPKTTELRVAYDAPTLQSTYTYSISWEDDEEGVEAKYIEMLNKKLKGDQLKTAKSTLSNAIPISPVVARCDGPCKKEFPSSLLSTIGRCDHYLCSACYGIVKNSDGTVACSSRNCFWKGASRAESKKNYEKDVCRKQREKALKMNALGIDVKPASAASSNQEVSTSSSISMPNNSETNFKSSAISSVIQSFRNSSQSESRIKVRLILVEPSETYGMTHTYMEKKFKPGTKMTEAIDVLLRRKRRVPENILPVAKLYFGLMKDDESLGMRRIKTNYCENLLIDEVPKLKKRLVLVMDMGDFVTEGARIYLE